MVIAPIAHIESAFPQKFGVPRQSGLVEALRGKVVFVPPYRSREALRGIEGFSHIWLIWGFSEVRRGEWSPTVRPPRLGGNRRLGVFATRSPFRPNPLGLSCVRLLEVGEDASLLVGGADLTDGTPIYDIKPYLPYADCRPEALGGFAAQAPELLEVVLPPELVPPDLSAETLDALRGVLALDPRPRYQDDPERAYGMSFAGYEIRFRVAGERLYVFSVEAKQPGQQI